MIVQMTHMSDFHGRLPDYVPKCDILTISGDICPNFKGPDKELQHNWLQTMFLPWVRFQRIGKVIFTWGNHDLVGLDPPDLSPTVCLVDQAFEYMGLRFYATPWTRTFGRCCAFMVDEERLATRFEAIPECDVLLSHSPPAGYGDLAPEFMNYPAERVGSPALLAAIERVKPQLTVYGHIHEGNGIYEHNGLTLVNASIVDVEYLPIRPFYVTEWKNGKLTKINFTQNRYLNKKVIKARDLRDRNGA
jgi:Icc-related predicted phosphoesterase